MNKSDLAKNVSVAFLAQGISFFLSILQSLLVPKILGIEEYGYWQLFIFYSSYVGLFHLGLNDGIYLIKGGQRRDEIDKRSVNSQFAIATLFEILVSFGIVAVAKYGDFDADRSFVITCTGLYLVIQNAAWYLMYLLQAMNETRKSSFSTMVNRISFLLPLVYLLMSGTRSFRPFVLSYIVSASLQLTYCLWCCRDFCAAGFEDISLALRDAFASIRVGSKLMLANIASQLLLGVLRFAIDAKWGVETFGRLSFSLSMVNFFLAFVTQAAMVLFPALRQSGEEEVRAFYLVARDILSLFFPIVYLLFFPMTWLLGLWLPAYADSMRFFALLIPICVFDSKMNITCTTLFKVRRKESLLLRINILTAMLCSAAVLLCVFILESVEFSIVSSTTAIIIRSLISEIMISSDLDIPIDSISVIELLLTVAFVFMSSCITSIAGFGIFVVLYTLFLYTYRTKALHAFKALRS